MVDTSVVSASMPVLSRSRRALVGVVVAAALALVVASTPAAAVPLEVRFSRPGYDYAPSILWDGSQWVMYHCGVGTGPEGYSSDEIYRSVSSDGLSWSDTTPVLLPGAAGSWDDRHVCDPSVLDHVSVAGATWAMWYTGKGGRGAADDVAAGPDRIGLAVSNDGIHWTKHPVPVLDCGTDAVPGCLQPSVVQTPDGFVMVSTDISCGNATCRLNRISSSPDGTRWSSGGWFTLPETAVGPDIMRGDDGTWYLAVGGNTRCDRAPDGEVASQVAVYSTAKLGDPVTLLGCEAWDDLGSQRGFFAPEVGFFRDGHGGLLPRTSALWVGFGFSYNQLHDPTEDIHGFEVDIPARPTVSRIAGPDRVATVAAISAATYLRARTALIARGDVFADALAAAPLASKLGGPILLSGGDRLPLTTIEELQRLGTRQVVLLGGESALGPQVETDAGKMGLDVRRVGGIDRFDTAARIAAEVGGSDVFVAGNWPDAIAASALAARIGAPILLTDPNQLPGPTADALRARPGVTATITGGTAVVSDQVATAMSATGVVVRRVAGGDRFNTSRGIADLEPAARTTVAAWLGTGNDWADVLVASAGAAAIGAPILLLDPGGLGRAPPVAEWLAAHRADLRSVRVVGGPNAIPDPLLDDLRDWLGA